MNKSITNVDAWFSRNKLNLNLSKTRYMVLNCKTDKTQLVKIVEQYIQRVWEKGKEKSFKLVGIQIDEQLKWIHHISYISRKIDYANYGFSKVSKELDVKNKKLL